MSRPVVVLLLLALFFGVSFGWRTWRQWKTTGSTGFRGISGRPGSVEWLGGVLFVVAIVLTVAAPLAELLGLLHPPAALPWGADLAAASLAVSGIVGTTWAQLAMGASWRIGVNQTEVTELVKRGPFRLVRNPIFSAMLLSSAGLVGLLPNAFSCSAFVTMLVAVELQVRFVEEPYLLAVHGERYAHYARSAGRFLPGFGKGLGRLETI